MKNIAIVLLYVLMHANASAQKALQHPLELTSFFGFQAHSKKYLSGYEEKSGLGTYAYGLGALTKLLSAENFQLKGGIGLGLEVNTYVTPFDHCFADPGKPCDEVLRHIDRYSVLSTSLPLRFDLSLSPRLGFVIDLLPQFAFYKTVKAANGGNFSKARMEFYSLECIPGIQFKKEPFSLKLGIRAAQLKAVDKVPLYRGDFLSKHPDFLDKNGDSYNPFKIQLGISYLFSAKGGN